MKRNGETEKRGNGEAAERFFLRFSDSPFLRFILIPFLMAGCATPPAVKPGYDFSKIHRIAIAGFEGPGGPAVAHEFMRELVASGLDVTERRAGADAVLTGAVTDYKTGQKWMVLLGQTTVVGATGQPVLITNPVVPLSGSQVTSEGSAFGLQNTQIVSVSASVGVIAQLVDAPSGNIVWSDRFNYEGLDVQGALEAVVSSLTKSLARNLPGVKP